MSDILDRKIAAAMNDQRIDIARTMSEGEVRDSYDFQLEQLTRLTTALDILFPERPRAGVASIQAAIEKLEELSDQANSLRVARDRAQATVDFVRPFVTSAREYCRGRLSIDALRYGHHLLEERLRNDHPEYDEYCRGLR